MSRRRKQRPPRSPCITAEGLKRLEREYQQLWSRERPKVTREVTEAAAQGDRSENAEYIYGKKRLREIDSRLEFLSQRIEEVEVIAHRDPGDGVVRFGCWVRVENPEGEEVEYRIVGPDEFDVDTGLISMGSPMGRALLDRCEGDEVTVRRPKGDIVFEILSVRYEE